MVTDHEIPDTDNRGRVRPPFVQWGGDRPPQSPGERLGKALVTLPQRPGFEHLPLETLVNDVLADLVGEWTLAAHQVHPFTDNLVFRRAESGLWAVFTVVIGMRGGRPSTWTSPEGVDDLTPVPFDDETPERRRRAVTEALRGLWVGTVCELAVSYLPEPYDWDPETLEIWPDTDRIAGGFMGPLVTLLDAAPPPEAAPAGVLLALTRYPRQIAGYRATGRTRGWLNSY